MLSKEELQYLLTQEEGSRLEFKKSAYFADGIGRTVCAFANSGGGLLVLGVERAGEKTSIVGLQNRDETYQKLTAILAQLRPRPVIEYGEHTIDHKNFIIAIASALSPGEVCFFKDRVYIRQGSVNVEIAHQELIEFLKVRGIISFEENRSLAKLRDLSEEKIRKYLSLRTDKKMESSAASLEVLLQSLGVANAVGEFYIKNVGVLVFANDLIRFFTNSEIRIVKYKGKVPSIEAREYDVRLTDTAPELLEKAFSTIKEKAGITAKIIEGKRVETPMLPDAALREVLTNAVGHRDYFDPNGILVEIFNDRIQFTNPGALLPGQTLKNFADIRRHRNPVLHRILNDIGWGDGLNLGVRAIIRTMRENNLPDPAFDDLGGFFKAVLFGTLSDRVIKSQGQITQFQQKAISYLEKHKFIIAPYYAKMIGVSHPTGIRYLNDLVSQGILKKLGSGRSSRYVIDKKQ